MPIRNIVFDLGGVLINFDPQNYLSLLGLTKEEIILFNKIVFFSKEWGLYNTSKISLFKLKENLLKIHPDHRLKLLKIFQNLDFKYILFEIKASADFLISLKKLGFNIFLLSDLSLD
ncbi:MAG: hypothetical protein HFE04_03775, partial [Bacilli bacterium]|nr:hypothetical protein [Bacilli bacterium]